MIETYLGPSTIVDARRLSEVFRRFIAACPVVQLDCSRHRRHSVLWSAIESPSSQALPHGEQIYGRHRGKFKGIKYDNDRASRGSAVLDNQHADASDGERHRRGMCSTQDMFEGSLARFAASA